MNQFQQSSPSSFLVQSSHAEQGYYVVVGLGSSGLSAAKYLHALGYHVAVTDEAAVPGLAPDLPAGVAQYFGGLDHALLQAAQGIIISPGVNPAHPAITAARQAGVAIVSDVQLFVDECHARGVDIVAITGSNAKSTVTTLVGLIAKACLDDDSVGVGGNLGEPALNLLSDKLKLAVLELSSFQLEAVRGLGARVATILNLSPDHLDRHGDIASYLNAKLAIFEDAKSAVLFGDDEALLMHCQAKLAANLVPDVPKHVVGVEGDFGISADGRWLMHADTPLIQIDQLRIKGAHNCINALFALAIGYELGFEMSQMLAVLKDFAGLDHRCQHIRTLDGVEYFNDSKGTNIGSTMAAINGLGAVYGEHALVLILGGQGKGQAFGELAPLIDRYVHTVLLIGQDAQVIEQDLMAHALSNTPLIQCQTLENAMEMAQGLAGHKAVLLSPACASFDQFTGFVARGERFVSLVQAL